jgi:hypothetical protein
MTQKSQSIAHTNRATIESIVWGYVKSIDNEKQTMNVFIPTTNLTIPNIPINNNVSRHGIGIRVMPIPQDSVVLLIRDGMKYFHFGYALEEINRFTDNSTSTKQTAGLLQRYLESGEVQLLGIANNEILLANDGSVLIKTKDNSYVKLENYDSVLEANVANMKFNLDGVRIRAGNIRRPTKDGSKSDDFLVMTDDGSIKSESDLVLNEDGAYEDFTYLKEFFVNVGTVQDSTTGNDKEFVTKEPNTSSPNVGFMSLASQVVGEDGKIYKINDQRVQFLLRMTNGGGIAVTEDNSLYIMDFINKNFTKFSSGLNSKCLKASETNLIEVADQGIKLDHKKATIDLKLDSSNYPEITTSIGLSNNISRYTTINAFGYKIDMSEAFINAIAKDIILDYSNTLTIGPANASSSAEMLIRGLKLAGDLDTHTHKGPVGPPTFTNYASGLVFGLQYGDLAVPGVILG